MSGSGPSSGPPSATSAAPPAAGAALGHVALRSRDPARVRLRVGEGEPRDVAEVPLEGALVGRNARAEIGLVGDPEIVEYISSFHALIHPRGSFWTLSDNHSTHGTSIARLVAPEPSAEPSWREFRLAPSVPTPLLDGSQLCLAGLIRFDVTISGEASELAPTRGRERLVAMSVLIGEADQELARILVDAHRGGLVPGRRELAAQLGWSESKVNKRRLALAEFPPVATELRREQVLDVTLPVLARALAAVLPYY